jgi:peptidoglycan/xylan/chitin deacetylase (PgdA/CDA1 family)
MHPVRPPFIYRWLSPKYLVCDLPGPEKVIYLTFDDGPIPEATPEILGILKAFGVKATFFMVGENVQKHPGIYEAVRAGGHAAGNHTFHHLNGWRTSPGSYIYDVERCRELVPSNLFRPPYGRFTPSQYLLLREQYRFILWSVLTWDFDKHTSSEQCLRNALENTKAGSVVVFHDSLKSIEKVRFALPKFLDHFCTQGYHFHTL